MSIRTKLSVHERPRVAIVGAGLGGLSAAIAIARSGCEVTVYEQASSLGEVGAGINLTPNVLLAMRELGLEQGLLERAFRPEHHVFRDFKSGRALFRARVKGLYERHFGAPLCNVHRADLHELLRNALPVGTVRLNARCVAIEQSDASATITFADSTRAEADVVIGADGIRSVVRECLFGADAPRFTGNVAWRFTVPASELPPGLVQPDVTNWMGPGGHVVHYYVRRGELVNVVAVYESGTWTEESWAAPGSREELLQVYRGWNGALQTLFGHAHECFKWGLFDRAPLPRWTEGRVTLMGDAAHAMLPFLGQGAAMAIEDGVALGLMLGAHRTADVRKLLAAYETLRRERTARAQTGSRTRATENHLRSPLARLRRNLKFRIRQWLNPDATLHAGEWLYRYDVTRACNDMLNSMKGSIT